MREKGGGNSKLAKDNGREAERDNGTVGKTACKSGQAEVYCKGRRERARKGNTRNTNHPREESKNA